MKPANSFYLRDGEFTVFIHFLSVLEHPYSFPALESESITRWDILFTYQFDVELSPYILSCSKEWKLQMDRKKTLTYEIHYAIMLHCCVLKTSSFSTTILVGNKAKRFA